MKSKKTEKPLAGALGAVGSLGTACVLLMLLFVLVFAATLKYKDLGEAGVKQEFFIPWIAHLGALPFPGGRTVFSLLALNLLVGGLIRIPWAWRTAGVLIAHLGVVVLALAGVVNFTRSDYGMATLYEGETINNYRDYTQVELSVWDASQTTDVTEYTIGDADLRSCSRQGRVFSSPELPFDVEVSGFLPHAQILPKGPMWEADSPVVDGWALKREDAGNTDPKYRVPALVVRVGDQTALLGAGDYMAWTFEADGKLWALHLHHTRHRLPFKLTLVDTVRENYPGTNTPKVYRSDVIYGPEQRKVTISMNRPLRTEGHVLYQSNWGRDRRGEYSGFSVARNPSDQWPKWSCWIIGAGLILTFFSRLVRYTVIQARLREKEA